MRLRLLGFCALCACPLGAATGCASPPPSGSAGATLRIVAAENFWGSIASQLGGVQAQPSSIVVSPNQDPHAYEARAGDARALASASLAIVNGVGYDPWATQLLSAEQVPGRAVLNVGTVLALHEGDNPHRWYSPSDVTRVAQAITAALERLRPRASSYFAQRYTAFENQALTAYRAAIAGIAKRHAGTAVGASESIFALLAPSLGLKILTPASYMNAVSEGVEVTPQDEAAVRRQIETRAIRLWIYNSQNITPLIGQLNAEARKNKIPIVAVTETLTPATASFEQWQVAQLQEIERALR